MKKLSIFASIVFSVSLAITGYSAFSVAKNATKVDATVGNYTTNASTYYSGITATSGTSLLGQLHDLMVTTHKTYTSYDDVGKNLYQQYLDVDPNDSSKVIDFYSGYSMDKTWTPTVTGGYNREHLWCQSLSNSLWGETGGGADMHHLRPLEMTENSTRNNNPYGEVTSHTSTYLKYPKDKNKNYLTDYPGGYLQNGVWEPMDAKKGDVARIVLYVYMHYNTYSNVGGTKDGSTSSFFGTLPITNVMSCGSESAAWAMLVKWNKNDPVDSLETTRNNVAAKYQGNRNPFIDHPEYVDAIWGSTPVTVTPSLTMPESASVVVGNTTSVAATLTNGSGTISYSSSNTSVATVSSSGVVTGKAAGSATITASVTISGTKYTATCAVTVTSSSVSVTGVTLNKSSTSLEVGASETLTATVAPTNATNKSVTWSSSNTSVATVSSSGLVTAVSAGSATITVKTSDGNKTATCTVTVTAKADDSSDSTDVPAASSDWPFYDGVAYHMYTINTDKSTSKYYFTGSMVNTYYGSTSTSVSSATDLYFEETTGGHYLYFMSSSTKTYVSGYYDSGYYDFSLSLETPSVWTYDSSINSIVTVHSSKTIALGSYTKTSGSTTTAYTSIAARSSTSSSYFSKFELVNSNTAFSFGANLLNNLTCDGGKTAPSKTVWSSLSTEYSALETGWKNLLASATANQSGNNVEKAVARYDYIVKKYGTSNYSNFIGRSIQSAPAVLKSNIDGNSDLVIIIVISSMTALLSGYYLFSKRKEQ